jgi:hypothetical protein
MSNATFMPQDATVDGYSARSASGTRIDEHRWFAYASTGLADVRQRIADLSRELSILSLPAVQEIARVNPDARVSWSLYADMIELSVDVRVGIDEDGQPLAFERIDAHPDVGVDSFGYELRSTVTLWDGSRECPRVDLQIVVSQAFTAEETELLHAIGKLTEVHHSYTSSALTCGL